MSSRERQIRELAEALFKGELSLFIGSGVSQWLGVPNWRKLVIEIVREVEANSDVNNDLLSALINELEDRGNVDILLYSMGVCRDMCGNDEFVNIVRSKLYEATKDKDDNDIGNNEMFSSLAHLCISAGGGRLKRIFTYNFDDLMERALRHWNVPVQVISVLPEIERSGAVKVFHIHGFMPSDSEYSWDDADLVFADTDFFDRMTGKDSAWIELLCYELGRRVPLFVGLSLNDPLLLSAIHIARKRMAYKAGFEINERFGYSFIEGKQDSPEALRLRRRGIEPICIDDFQECPEVIRSIRQTAVRLA